MSMDDNEAGYFKFQHAPPLMRRVGFLAGSDIVIPAPIIFKIFYYYFILYFNINNNNN